MFLMHALLNFDDTLVNYNCKMNSNFYNHILNLYSYMYFPPYTMNQYIFSSAKRGKLILAGLYHDMGNDNKFCNHNKMRDATCDENKLRRF